MKTFKGNEGDTTVEEMQKSATSHMNSTKNKESEDRKTKNETEKTKKDIKVTNAMAKLLKWGATETGALN